MPATHTKYDPDCLQLPTTPLKYLIACNTYQCLRPIPCNTYNPLRSVPRPPTTSLTRDRSPPTPSRTHTVLTDRSVATESVARVDLAFAPKRPPPSQTASEPLAPSEVATTDLAPNARPVRLPASPHLPDLGKPTGHHQLVHRVLLHNRSTVVLLSVRTYSAIHESRQEMIGSATARP